MRLAAELELRKLQAAGNEWFETYGSYTVIPNEHPPSLRNPKRTKIPIAQDGYKKGASRLARQQAKDDLLQLHKRVRRQIGKPEITHVAQMPLFPNMLQWM